MLRFDPHLLKRPLSERTDYKIRRARREAAGFAGRVGGPQPAFPVFVSQPELLAFGTVKTLTLLLDFRPNDPVPGETEQQRRSSYYSQLRHPNLTRQRIEDNIYGKGTTEAQAFKPFESLNAYYKRASQYIPSPQVTGDPAEHGVDVQGNVLPWLEFPKKREDYTPATAAGATSEIREREQMKLDNERIFEFVSEALDKHDATNDYSEYDNDNDGDIDLVTILYTGPPGDWGEFWWAYRWEFHPSLTPQAATRTFDGVKVKQFVFQFIDTRSPANDDFAPNTLLHEMGHAFGLADYYDYFPIARNATGQLVELGPQGGVGGLDMMHANKGNHNAFSRFLLDWIKPECVGSGSPAIKTLTASGSTLNSNKAVAIFPELQDSTAPNQEMFFIENRCRFGNDEGISGTPGEGLLIWHVDASGNVAGNDFAFDNSITPHKLIRLVRSDTANDFRQYKVGPDGVAITTVDAEGNSILVPEPSNVSSATSNTYFRTPQSFTNSSVSPSHRYDGRPTNVVVDQISANGETMTARIGFTQPTPVPAPPAHVAATPSGDGITLEIEAVIEASHEASQEPVVDLDMLEQLDRKLSRSTANALAEEWKALSSGNIDTQTKEIVLQMISTHWAAKAGQPAIEEIKKMKESKFRSETYSLVAQSWANSDPSSASKWYFTDANVSENLGRKFTATVFEFNARQNLDGAIDYVDKLESPDEIWGALEGLRRASQETGTNLNDLNEKFRNLKNGKVIESLDTIQNGLKELNESIHDPSKRLRFEQMLRNNFGQ